jgi:hypothetical protein
MDRTELLDRLHEVIAMLDDEQLQRLQEYADLLVNYNPPRQYTIFDGGK